ncbi:hypothetical protein M432DRAFT_143384 [Thermoascus aurantiacus ATCC 26904]
MAEISDPSSPGNQTGVHTPRRRTKPSPVRLRLSPQTPRTPTERVASLNMDSDLGPSPRERLFQEHPGLGSEAHFPQVDLGFSLIGSDCRAITPSDQQFKLLQKAFPTSTGIGVSSGLLTVQYHVLPPQPWPLIIAGLPVYVTTDEIPYPFPPQKLGGHKRILGDYDTRGGASKEFFKIIVDYFEKDLSVTIVYILNLLGQWVITVPDNTILSELPCQIAKSPCSYNFASEVKEPQEAPLHAKKPDGVTWDTSSYDILRPGVMLSSGKIEGRDEGLLTTSGIQVIDGQGNEFITVASHGFPDGHDDVYHPNLNGEIVGHIQHRIPDSDISLANCCQRNLIITRHSLASYLRA